MAKTAKSKEEGSRRVRRSPEVARGEILSAAERLMAARGPDAVGLQEIAREAKVSHSLISHYFGTYDNLVDEVLSTRLIALAGEVMGRLEEESFPKTPNELLDRLFSLVSNPSHLRLAAWAMLSGRLQGPEAFPARMVFLRKIADAIHARLAAVYDAISLPPPRIEDTEHAVLVAVVSAYGYSLGKTAFLAALGREESPQTDAWFREKLGELLRARLAPPGWR